MNKLKILIFLGFVAFASDAKPKKPGIVVKESRNDVFYFKVKKGMLGGTVKVFNHESKLVAEKSLDTRKNIIHFLDERPGNYTIRISGADGEQDFQYSNDKHIPKQSR